jgi:DNA-directed RNA polymerase subunit H (RpoH/RPB5)
MNVVLCFEEYRKWTLLTKYDKPTFEKNMSANKFVIHLMWAPNLNIFIYVVLFHSRSHYVSKTEMFRKFLHLLVQYNKGQEGAKKKFRDGHKISPQINAILITKQELTKYYWKSIVSYSTKLNIENYLHKHFLIEISKGPLCSRHTILSKQEAIDLCAKQLKTAPHNLQTILPTDPHVIWCGAQVGDIIKIEINSELAGKCIRYREVMALSGKVVSDIFDDEVEYIEPIGEDEPEPEPESETEAEPEEDDKKNDETKDIISEDDEDNFSDY